MTVPVRVSESNIDLVVTCLVSCMLARVSVLFWLNPQLHLYLLTEPEQRDILSFTGFAVLSGPVQPQAWKEVVVIKVTSQDRVKPNISLKPKRMPMDTIPVPLSHWCGRAATSEVNFSKPSILPGVKTFEN